MRANRFGAVKKRRRGGVFGVFLPVVVFLVLVVLFNMGVTSLTQSNEQEALEAARSAVVRAVVTFYAIEGRFPPSIDYLTENFGLAVDQERFIIHYNLFASNIMPQITVLPRQF